MAKTLSATIGLLFLIAFIAAFGLTGCEKIVEVEKTVYDTLTVHDTVAIPTGPAYVRFVSLLPDRGNANILLFNGPTESSAPFGLAGSQSKNEFIPVPARAGKTVYAIYYRGNVKTLDSIIIPPLEPTNLYTGAVFMSEDPDNGTARLAPRFSWDTLKMVPAGEGRAYLRLINGLADFPVPAPRVNLHITSAVDSAIFPEPVDFRSIANYIEVPVGNYQLYLSAPGEPGHFLAATMSAVQGGYYTAMVHGKKADNTLRLEVTREN